MHTMPDPLFPGCLISNPPELLLAFATILITEISILLLMMSGLFKRRLGNGLSGSLWKQLYHQGLAWLVLAIIAEVPAVVSTSVIYTHPLLNPAKVMLAENLNCEFASTPLWKSGTDPPVSIAPLDLASISLRMRWFTNNFSH